MKLSSFKNMRPTNTMLPTQMHAKKLTSFLWDVKVGEVDGSKPFNCETISSS